MKKHTKQILFTVLWSILIFNSSMVLADSPPGLLVLYDFSEGEGTVIKDVSGVGEPVPLHIKDPAAVRWDAGSLEIIGKTRILSEKAPDKLFKGMRWTGEITIEAWVRPANVTQKGPARIITFSKNGSERNFTLGQDNDHYDIRFRTRDTSKNGTPSLASAKASLVPELTHVVYTRTRSGRGRVYLNGVLSKEQMISGDLSTWRKGYRLALGNELVDDRAWLGTYHRVALYNRALLPSEVREQFHVGVNNPIVMNQAETPALRSARIFEHDVAPLLAKHCLECHNPNEKKGKLDLSSKTAAFAGEWLDQVIVAGDASDSTLWEQVESNDMPHKRDPLSDSEKKILREWIDTGAVWTHERIDPAVYEHDSIDSLFIRRLTHSEYIATVQHTLGVDIATEARKLLPEDVRADGFSNTAYNLHVDLAHVNSYAQLAEIITDKLDVLTFVEQFTKKQDLGEKATFQLVEDMGLWILRGPLEQREKATYIGISNAVQSSGGDFEETVRYIIETMLQSPRFIYRIEKQRGDNQAWPVSEYELASRLSYTLWGSSPDKELIRAAKANELHDPKKLEQQVDRMLLDPRAVQHSKEFAYEWLNLGRLDNLRPNKEIFPNWNAQLGIDMREETLSFFEEVIWKQQRPLAELFNAQVTYLTPELAKHYGLNSTHEGLTRYDLSAVPERGGLLTQGSLLTVGGDNASMVSRGLFILHDVLRGTVNDPPPGLDITPIPPSPGQSHRVIAEKRLSQRACGGCHTAFEPLAFGLERFDGLGTYQVKDAHGNVLREDGAILFPGDAKTIPYQSTTELMDLLAQSDRVSETLTWKVAQFSLGRQLGADDAVALGEIHTKSQQAKGTYASLLKAIVMSDLIQTTPTETYE